MSWKWISPPFPPKQVLWASLGFRWDHNSIIKLIVGLILGCSLSDKTVFNCWSKNFVFKKLLVICFCLSVRLDLYFRFPNKYFFLEETPSCPIFQLQALKNAFFELSILQKKLETIFFERARPCQIFFLQSLKIQDSAIFRDAIFCRFFLNSFCFRLLHSFFHLWNEFNF